MGVIFYHIPWANSKEVKEEYGVEVIKALKSDIKYEVIILTVAHDEFRSFDFEKYYKQRSVVFDAKVVVDRRWVDGRL